MLSVKTKRNLSIVLVLSLLGAVLLGWYGARAPMDHLVSALLVEDKLYAVNQGEREVRFYQTDETGRIRGQIRRSIRDGSSYRSYDGLVRDGNAVYVLERTADIASDLIQAETVYYCNFDRGQLEPIWELPIGDGSQDTNLDIQVNNGILYFFRSDYSGTEATATLYRMEEGWEPVEAGTYSYDIGIGFTDFYVGDSGAVVFTTPAGEAYLCEKGGEPEKVYPLSGTSNPILHFTNDGGDLVWIGGANGRVYQLDLAQNTGLHRSFWWKNLGLSDYAAVSFSPDKENDFAAILSDGRALGLYRDGALNVLNGLRALDTNMLLAAAGGFILVWFLAFVVWQLSRFYFFLTKDKVPIVTKLLAVFLPILIVSLLLMNVMTNSIFKTQLVDGQYERLFLLTSQQTATLSDSYIEDVDPDNAYDNIYFYEIRAALNVLPGQGSLRYPDSHETQEVYNSNYFWLYKLVDGQLVSLVCEQDYVGVPVEARHSSKVSELFYQTLTTGQPVRTGFRDSLGDWTVLLTPVFDQEGHPVAVIETGDTRQSLDYAVDRGTARLTALNLSFMLVLAILLSTVIAVALYPLRVLKHRVDEVSQGKLGVTAPEKGRDEVAEITRAFNTMSKNVAFRDKEIRDTSDGYSRFVPARVFDILEKSSVIDVRLEDQTDVDATVLNCSVGSFDDIARSLHSKEMFRLINQVLARLVPVVNTTGGLVDRFDKAGLLAIYTDKPEQALDAAVTLCQTLRASVPEQAGEEPLDFHVTLSAGPAMIGIVGAEERLEAMTVSEHTSFTGFLKPLAVQLGAAVLMTGSAASLIPDFENRYHARTVGFVYMKTLDKMERLYDVYDGDDEVTRQLKEETAEHFEKGVALFCSHQYYDARLLFIEVLKKNRRDPAAKHYLYLCDTYYRENAGEDTAVYLETY